MTKEQLIDSAIKQATVSVSVSDVLEGVRMGIKAGVAFTYDQMQGEIDNLHIKIKDLESAHSTELD